jgi:uncharacterized protein YegP (UPF0339 family)
MSRKLKIEYRKNTDGQWYFVFIAKNNKAAGGSLPETYHNLSDAEDTVEMLKSELPDAVTHIKYK